MLEPEVKNLENNAAINTLQHPFYLFRAYGERRFTENSTICGFFPGLCMWVWASPIWRRLKRARGGAPASN